MKRLASVLVAALVFLACSAQAAAPIAASTAAGTAMPGTTAMTGRTMTAGATSTLATTAGPSLAQMVGQKLVVAMDGLTPSADLLGRIRRGEIGGVILFGFNITSRSELIALTSQLRAAAAAGGQPRLLIAVDQEGGSIKRIPWAPPALSPPQMGKLGSTTTAHTQGAMTGAALKGLGINVDFAPVADVPSSPTSFMYRAGRTWSFSSTVTAALSDAFASGLRSTGVVPSMKHFPGIGRSPYNTDDVAVTFWSSAATLAPGLRPYRLAISHHIPMIMLSNGRYMAYDTVNGAGWSHAISVNLLRGQLGFTGVTITDSLSGAAASRGLATWQLAVPAARAGTDMILVTGSEASTRYIYSKLVAYATSRWISRTALAASYHRILALKAGL